MSWPFHGLSAKQEKSTFQDAEERRRRRLAVFVGGYARVAAGVADLNGIDSQRKKAVLIRVEGMTLVLSQQNVVLEPKRRSGLV